jgi:4-hydroxyphenylpyruvate dioxygenase
MPDYLALRILDFDHLEFAVADLDRAAEVYLRLGFEKTLSRQILERKLESHLFVQNDIRVVLSRSEEKNDPVARYVAAHGDGVINVAFRCEDATTAFELAVNRGARIAEPPRGYTRDFGAVVQATIKTFGDLCHTFISRKGDFFAEGFEAPLRAKPKGYGLQRIDHVTINVDKGQLSLWAAFYKNILGLRPTRSFDIHTERSGLYSQVLESSDRRIKFPLNEPTGETSQIQEFLDVHHGPGARHVALTSNDIVSSLSSIRKEGIRFLEIPSTYYEAVLQRVPGLSENLGELESLGILADGDASGSLLQSFSQNLVGPLFYEIIQRKGNEGFGEGNFKALFEAIERDQIRRGVLK